MAISIIYVGPNSPNDSQSCNLVAITCPVELLSSAATNVLITLSSAEAGKGYNSTTPATSPVASEPAPPLDVMSALCM
tara:strand:- start:4232 stop:4465 length:234 start_codon:yes stop_codon:yes gene_type:complete